MAMRVPVVASALDGISEVVEDGRDGFLVRSGDGERFCERVCHLLESPSLAENIGGAASEKISRKFSSGRMCREVEQVYDSHLK